jgi:hypothetical protein
MRVAKDAMDSSAGLEAGELVDIKESPGLAHKSIVTGFSIYNNKAITGFVT